MGMSICIFVMHIYIYGLMLSLLLRTGASGNWDPADWSWNPVRMRAEPVARAREPAEARSTAPTPSSGTESPQPPSTRTKTIRKSVRENLCQADDCRKPLTHLSFYHQRNR